MQRLLFLKALYVKLDTLAELRLVSLADGRNDLLKELHRLLRRSAYKMGGTDKLGNIQGLEAAVALEPFDEIVGAAMEFDLLGSGQ